MAYMSIRTEIVKEFVKALGINEHSITKVVMTMEVDEVVRVDVTRFVKTDEMAELIEKLEHYEIHPKE